MKKLIVLLSFLMLSLVSHNTYADSTPAPITSATQALSPEDIKSLQDQINQLSKVVGADTPASKTSEKTNDHKTVADVADKALSMFSGLVASLSDSMKKIAPHIWEIMVRQQYATAIGNVIVPLLLLLTSALYMIGIRKYWSSPDEDTNTDTIAVKVVFRSVIPLILMAIFSIYSVIEIANSVQMLINPEYYALKDLLSLVKGTP